MALRKPEWLKIKLQGDNNSTKVEHTLSNYHLNTVCEEANCPNKMECYTRRTATFMILGKNCTRNCKFCNVTTARPEPLDPLEPMKVAYAVKQLGLKHAVITSVDRDDLKDDYGSYHFAAVTREIKKMSPGTTIELLIPDFDGRHDLLDLVFAEKPDIINHNVEVVEDIFDEICPQSDLDMSLEVLRYAKEKGFITKSGMMVGFGETEEQVVDMMKKLRAVDCDMLTIGQYLQPSKKHAEVKEYVHPDQFERYKEIGLSLGFKSVSSGPFVRSSYHAEMLTDENEIDKQKLELQKKLNETAISNGSCH
ncbi:MAG: lipoyl synthase [Ezakiella sp.]|nr:lipoyl synthase [Ezakiella sp.]MDD7761328.1 lipoyl synthase [Bacillota bacterium]MDY3947125.1 lipoyl synthase [Ezakiella sp.]